MAGNGFQDGFICVKMVSESDLSKNLEVPQVLALRIGGRAHITLEDDIGVFNVGIGWRRDGRAFFRRRGWRNLFEARQIHVGSVLTFWENDEPATFTIEIMN